MENWLPANLLESLGITLLHSVWQLTLIGLVLYLVLLGLGRKSPGTRYNVSVFAMFMMLLVPIFTFIYVYEPGAAQPELINPTGFLIGEFQAQNPNVEVAELSFTEQVSEWLISYRQYTPYVVLVWGLGALFFALRFAGGFWFVQRLKRTNVKPAATKFQERVQHICYQLGISRKVKLLLSTRVNAPVVFGHLKPVILFPATMLTGLSDTQLEYILAHELAHIRRNDYLINLMQSLVEIVLFFHPTAWIVSRYIRQERENCCDEIVVQLKENKMEYVNALLQIETFRNAGAKLGLAANGGNLFARIKRIMEKQVQRPNHAHGLLFGLLLAGALVISMATRPTEPELSEEVLSASLSSPEGPEDVGNATIFGPLTQYDGDFVVIQDSPVKKISILTDEGENIKAIMDQDGSIIDLTVNGKVVDGSEYDEYAARVNHAAKGNTRVMTYDGDMDELDPKSMERFERDMEKFGADMEEFGRGMEEMAKGFENMGESFSEEDAEKLERWGEEFGKRMERWGEDFGERMENDEKWEAFEERWENWGDQLDERMEARGERIEALAEREDWDGFNAEMNAMMEDLGVELGGGLGAMLGELLGNLGADLGGMSGELNEELALAMEELKHLENGPDMDRLEGDMERLEERMEREAERQERAMERAEEARERAEERREEAMERAEEARERAEERREEARERAEESRDRAREERAHERRHQNHRSNARHKTESAVIRDLANELASDGLIRRGQDFNFRINQKRAWINGDKISKRDYDRYLDLVDEHTLVNLRRAKKFDLDFNR